MSLSTLPSPAAESVPGTAPVLDVVVPVYNEEIDLEPCVRRLHAYLAAALSRTGSGSPSPTTPAPTPRRGRGPAEPRSCPRSRRVHLEQKGRGRALSAVWLALGRRRARLHGRGPVHRPGRAAAAGRAADLRALRPGDRLPAGRGSRVVRGAKREFISRCYNLILRGTLAARFSDAQCGFKAIRADVAQRLLPMVEDTGWFFDTEMLVLAETLRPAHPRGAGRLGRRPGQPGRHRRAPRSPTCAASPGWPGRWAPASCPWPRCATARPQPAAGRRRVPAAGLPASCCASPRSAWPARSPTCCSSPCCGALGPQRPTWSRCR